MVTHNGRQRLFHQGDLLFIASSIYLLLFCHSGLNPISTSTSLSVTGFTPTTFTSSSRNTRNNVALFQAKKKKSTVNTGKGFGASPTPKKPTKPTSTPSSEKNQSKNRPYVKSEQDRLLNDLLLASSHNPIGKAIESCQHPIEDPFYEMLPSLIQSKFPSATDSQLTRIAGFVAHAIEPEKPLEDDIINDEWRPHDEIHAYMPGLGETQPFLEASQLKLCQLLTENYDTILQEYETMMEDETVQKRFQSVTSMNYEAGWKTLVLFYNGHRIDGFPYHKCPVTTRIMETVPLAGRIAGFNRQRPGTGIPKHSDGNNMWLTCQMGVKVPKGKKAYIRVGPETRYWEEGQCLVYDTTYEHETMNESEDEERVVLHIDFFNILKMTPLEISIMQYIYEMREKFMKAEGVAKVGAQVL